MIDRRSFLAIAAVALMFAGSAGAAEPIKIGELNSYTRLPAFTFPYRDGWQMALDEINAAGGVLGRPLEVISKDDGGKPGDAVTVAGELIARDGVVLLFGTLLSNVGLAVSDVAKQKEDPVHRRRAAFGRHRLGTGQPLHLPPPPGDLRAGGDAGGGGGQAAGQALGDGGPQLRVRPVGGEGVQGTALGQAPRCRVGRRAVAGAVQDRRRRHGPGAGPGRARRHLQCHLRRRPRHVRPRGNHPRPVRGPHRRQHAGAASRTGSTPSRTRRPGAGSSPATPGTTWKRRST